MLKGNKLFLNFEYGQIIINKDFYKMKSSHKLLINNLMNFMFNKTMS